MIQNVASYTRTEKKLMQKWSFDFKMFVYCLYFSNSSFLGWWLTDSPYALSRLWFETRMTHKPRFRGLKLLYSLCQSQVWINGRAVSGKASVPNQICISIHCGDPLGNKGAAERTQIMCFLTSTRTL